MSVAVGLQKGINKIRWFGSSSKKRKARNSSKTRKRGAENDPRSIEGQIKTIHDSMLVILEAQNATIGWLINIGYKQSAQLEKELKVELAKVRDSLEKLKQFGVE